MTDKEITFISDDDVIEAYNMIIEACTILGWDIIVPKPGEQDCTGLLMGTDETLQPFLENYPNPEELERVTYAPGPESDELLN